LSRHADLTLTLGDGDATETGRARLHAMGFREQRAARPRVTPAMALVRAPGIEREAEEIARLILEQAAAGRPFREMGIVVHAQAPYVPVLRSTLERFGIGMAPAYPTRCRDCVPWHPAERARLKVRYMRSPSTHAGRVGATITRPAANRLTGGLSREELR